MQMECSCGKKCDALLMVRIWFPGTDDAVFEWVCPDCKREYENIPSSNPFDVEEEENEMGDRPADAVAGQASDPSLPAGRAGAVLPGVVPADQENLAPEVEE